jgi:hypothetical protein
VRSISDPGRTTSFVYDHDGDRIIKAGAQGETVYVNDKWTVEQQTQFGLETLRRFGGSAIIEETP